MRTLILALALTLAAGADQFRGLVDNVHDGDTIRLRTTEGMVKVRLQNIDAPEIAQPGGIQSRDELRHMAPLGQPVIVETTGRDKYGRTLGEVFRGGQNLNLALVRHGQAWVYRKYCTAPNYLLAERQAQTEHLGVWATQDAMAPWVFRHQPKRPAIK